MRVSRVWIPRALVRMYRYPSDFHRLFPSSLPKRVLPWWPSAVFSCWGKGRGTALTGRLTRNCVLAFTLAASTLPPNTLQLPLDHLKYAWGFHTWGEECLKDSLCYVSQAGPGFTLQLRQASDSWGSSDNPQTSNPPAFAYQLTGWQSVSSSCLYPSLEHSLKEPLPSCSFVTLLFTAMCCSHQRAALARAIHAPFCSGCWGHL